MIADVIVSVLLVAGATFIFLAAVGLLRLPDVYTRMHAVSKASSLGAGLILSAVSIHYLTFSVIAKCLLTILFIFLTTPVAAHLLGRAAYLSRSKVSPLTKPDELNALYASNPQERPALSTRSATKDPTETGPNLHLE